MAKLITGHKGGQSKSRTPSEHPDDLQSVAKAKILLALGEGEFAGGLSGRDIYLNGTPLQNADGTENFTGVVWDFRPGTQMQTHIPGIPGTENEISVGTAVSDETAWTHTFTNTQLSAIRLRLKWPSLYKQESNGDLVGNSVAYAVDLQTDGGTWITVLNAAVTGKTTSGYERSHRIDLPPAGTTWTLRLRKITPDANSAKIGDGMTLQSYTEVIDAKLRYPNTALLYIEFDSSQFNGSIPQIACEPRGRVIRVPDNYDPETRQYSGLWQGLFKWAWTDNPAWVFYDLVVSDRFGLGHRLSAANIDKWSLYNIARYCDQPVPDGKGGAGTEPRYICNVYIQDRADAYSVLRDFAAIYRGLTCWSGDQIVTLADMPRDIDYTYTRANVINGEFRYSGTTSKVRYTNALVSWSDPDNAYTDATEPVFERDLVARYGFNQLELTAIGCTRQSEANRKGRWGILTNNKDRLVTFSVGLDGNIPQPGYIIGVADEMLAGKVNGGRICAVDGRVITLDRKTAAGPGDRLLVNLPSGVTQSRTIKAISGQQVTVTTAYGEVPQKESVWALEFDDLRVQQYRVTGVKENDDASFTIVAASHDPDKFARIDSGAVIEQRPVSVIPPSNQRAPDKITITADSVVQQGIRVATMRVSWGAVENAIVYQVQWRRNHGNWNHVPRTTTTSFDVTGIYGGQYQVRVRAINAADVSSSWGYSALQTLEGKEGAPAMPLALTTTSLLHGVELTWAFPPGAEDTQHTELQYSANRDGRNPRILSSVAYPGQRYQQMGLQIAAVFWYQARIVDRLGNKSPWTEWVMGMASDKVGDYYNQLTEAMRDTPAWQESQRDIREVHQALSEEADALRSDIDQQVSEVSQALGQRIETADKQRIAGDDKLSQQVKLTGNSLSQSLAQSQAGWTAAVLKESADRIQSIRLMASEAADQLLAEKAAREAAFRETRNLIQDVNSSLAGQMAQIAAGTGEQFDSLKIWYFDTGPDGWTEDDASRIPMTVTDDGWLRAKNTQSSARSPNHMAVDASAYRFIKLRIKRNGMPVWRGKLWWIGVGETGWSAHRALVFKEPEYDPDGVATLTIQDIPWNPSESIRRFRLDLAAGQNERDYFLIDWVAVGRPTPGAGVAALQEEKQARTRADAAEAVNRQTLATQVRGNSESHHLADLKSGLLFQEMNARITADKAEASARRSLQTLFDENQATVTQSLSSLTSEQKAHASKLSHLETRLGKKADSTALQSLTQAVGQQAGSIAAQGEALTALTNRVGKTESGNVVNARAINRLQSLTEQHGKTQASQGAAITTLDNGLQGTRQDLNKKADSTAVIALNNRVTRAENTLTSQSQDLTTLNSRINTLRHQISNPWFDGSLESYAAGERLGGASAFVVDSRKFTGSRSLCLRRSPGERGNSDKALGPWSNVRERAVYTFELWAMMPESESPSPGWQTIVGLWVKDMAGKNSWQSAIRITEATLGARDQWVKFTGKLRLPGAGKTRGVVWVSTRGANGNGTPGYELFIDDVVITDITDAHAAQEGADAAARALTSLTARVTSAEGKTTAQGQQITRLENELSTTKGVADGAARALDSLTNTVVQHQNDIVAVNSRSTQLQASLNRRTVFTVTARGNGSSAVTGLYDESGKRLFAPGRSYNLITFRPQSDGSTRVDSATKYDVYGSKTAAEKMVTDIAALDNGSWICVLTHDEPSRSREIIRDALMTLGGTSEVINTLPFRGAYILLGRKGLKAGGGLEVSAPGGNSAEAIVSTSVVFINGVMAGLGTASGAMMKSSANAAAISTLNNTVIQQGNRLTSQGTAITALKNGLSSVNKSLTEKADSAAVNTLTSRINKTEDALISQSQSVTTLTSRVNTLRNQISNPWFDGSLESYAVGERLGGASAFVVDSSKFTGSRSLCLRRSPGELGNSDKALGPWSNVRERAVYTFELWAMMPESESPSPGWQTIVGLWVKDVAGKNSWQSAIRITEATLGARDQWVKFTGKLRLPGAGKTRGVVWVSTRGANGNGTPGYELFIDDVVITDITDAHAAQEGADAAARALTSLTARVTSAEGKTTAQGQQITSLQNSVAGKADSSAVRSLTTRLTQAEGQITLATRSLTSLSTTVGDMSSTLQTQGKTVAGLDGQLSALYSIKVETDNGKKVGAGIVLGSDGETSSLVMYAESFALYNRASKKSVPVMIAKGNEMFIDKARIEDGTIDSGKISGSLQSTGYGAGGGWRLSKNDNNLLFTDANNVVRFKVGRL
ncbi:phage tail tip fiber protein [Shimwellia blattae]|uniref:Host specificity protein J n=1 Tax=Shimwellia blattae (strain ATCC 29907 / DSM 4481 / JCM 1650 / NBRC 105725 / CDC 9005-74) TaxID=630626 RepID=I2B9C6_SHIBC|nr:DUF1983 domain-containing protein [Shimwellia blattae]AFJ47130.1 host specificity protein J [Shimwellia blattae DSM 4481 = NBRC 105725]GAB80750.1 hypothetical protein EB105725_08_00350 [Shimwellia blattae DSM 4481 = NBRC 105725]VDY64623.1 Domain of uncharacterised function (DUF1983) [Shimwellia blattae]VEC22730.1 Domain of uncharacterised function (DUF1983) [Shimwellia blattae]